MLSINIIRIYFIQAVNYVVVASINNPLIYEESLSIGKRKKNKSSAFLTAQNTIKKYQSRPHFEHF
jgi:hypothetical protein